MAAVSPATIASATLITLEPPSTARALTDEPTTIIIAVVASLVGVLLVCLIIAYAGKKAKAKKANIPTEMSTEMTTTRDEAASERKRESHYHSTAPLAANIYNSSTKTESNDSSDQTQDGTTHRNSSTSVYHRPPASTTTAIAPERSSKPSSGNVSKRDASKDEQITTTGSLVRKSIRTAAAEVLHIPIEEIEMGKQLGQGAFGVVYKGQWDHKTVAVKQVKASNIIGGDKAIAEFEAEVSQMASTAYHENLVQLYGVTTLENGDMAAVVEFCAQGSLVDALYGSEKKVREWTLSELFSVAHGAACGVAHLHRQGVIHRDIAARNVLLAGKRDLIAKVADFGMARLLNESVYDEQTTLNAVGPLKWMAPEQMERRAYSRASDVFAFGVLLYEIFKREVPWQGVSNIVTAAKVMRGERMDVSSRKIPHEVAALMLECWAHEPDKRPSMKHVQRVLHDNAPNSDESGAES
jgi:hypothetical protein